MDIEIILTAVSTVGFPIVAVLLVWKKMDSQSKEYIELLKVQIDDNKTNTKDMIDQFTILVKEFSIISNRVDKVEDKVDSLNNKIDRIL